VKLLFLLLVLAATVMALAPGAGASGNHRCGLLHASTPYSRHGHREPWRVYIAGATSCKTAEETLNAVLHMEAKTHSGSSEADSFFTYKGWTCPFGNMGSQLCDIPSHAPFKALALALNCDVVAGGCPKRPPAALLPAS
jgi:hypothetical protein